jgi:sterol desaturase/sphingolipid hydroxylase (fatty acid hydroxylase superfamily)
MDELARAHYASIYAVLYFGAICAVALWEAAAPRRALTAPLRLRWFGNLSVTLLQSAVTWWLFPMASVGFAVLAAERGWGVLRLADVPYPVAFVLSLVLLDLSRYAQHRAQHRVPLLWRLHRMHHTDHDLDFTTGLRFHPLEALLTTSIAFCVVTALGAPVAAVAAYEACFVLSVMFAHGNIRIPAPVDRVLRRAVVTPDLHRVHHSAAAAETDSNYGGFVPWWDRLFGTYVDQPEAGHEGMTVGLAGYRGRQHLALHRMLADPFVAGPAGQLRQAGAGAP